MNTFSNSLFTFLFGWARSLIEGLWNAAAEGRLSGLLSWLGDHWLGLVILLCLAGTAVDFLVWIIRWRPYLVWRSTLRRWGRALRGERVDGQRRFSRGYRDAVDLDLPAESGMAGAQDRYWEHEAQAPSPAPAYGQPVMEEFSAAGRREENGEDWADEAPEERRRRRSEKHGQPVRKPLWKPRFNVLPGEEEGLLDGLPPAVDRQQAFHEPVYPTQPAWQNPNQPDQGKRT